MMMVTGSVLVSEKRFFPDAQYICKSISLFKHSDNVE